MTNNSEMLWSMIRDNIDMPMTMESSRFGDTYWLGAVMGYYRNRKVKCNEILTFFSFRWMGNLSKHQYQLSTVNT